MRGVASSEPCPPGVRLKGSTGGTRIMIVGADPHKRSHTVAAGARGAGRVDLAVAALVEPLAPGVPELAGIGATPARAASLAGVAKRWAPAISPTSESLPPGPLTWNRSAEACRMKPTRRCGCDRLGRARAQEVPDRDYLNVECLDTGPTTWSAERRVATLAAADR